MSYEPGNASGPRAETETETAEQSREFQPRARRQDARRAFKARLRRFFLHHVPLTVGGAAVLAALLFTGLYFYASSNSFQNAMRERLELTLSQLTGGRVEIHRFHWRLLDLEAEAGGVVIHGREAAGEAPYARIAHLKIKISVLGLLSPRVVLRDLEIDRPELHWIVYPDGSTNQPEPRRKKKAGEPALDQLFDLEAGRIEVNHGVLDYDNRAARFDFEDRRIPLDFKASDASLRMSYAAAAVPETPGARSASGAYRIELSLADLNLRRGPASNAKPNAETAVRGRIEARIDLTRNAATLRQLRVVTEGRDEKEEALEISGILQDFSHPHWRMRAAGDLDMRLLEPITGYPYAPEGIAHLDLAASGDVSTFDLSGRVHVDDGAYVGTGVTARGIGLDAEVRADPHELRITNVIARFSQGGEMRGSVDLTDWLSPSETAPGVETISPSGGARKKPRIANRARAQAADTTIPVNGKVTARLANVSLDTILGMVSEAPFQRLGIGTLLNGTATATWTKGDSNTVAVDADLRLIPESQRSLRGAALREAPASGSIDATYAQRDGSVSVRRLELDLPASSIEASGRLGAYPMTGPTSLSVSFHSHDLNEFDTVLRDLGLKRHGKQGVAALPAKLSGQADFDGTWTGSLLHPKIGGTAHANGLAIEAPQQAGPQQAGPEQAGPEKTGPEPTQFVSFDTVQASGSYSASRIAIRQAVLEQGAARIAVSGTLDAAPSAPGKAAAPRGNKNAEPDFSRGSMLHASVTATNVSVAGLQPLFRFKIPAAGSLDAQFAVHGPLDSLNAAGAIDVNNGSLYGEPVSDARARATMENQTLKLAAMKINAAGGTISGSGSFNFTARQFRFDARGRALDLDRIAWLRRGTTPIAGTLDLSLSGSGTMANPGFDGRATVSGLTVGGERLGSLSADIEASGGEARYSARTQLAGAELDLHGQTALRGEYDTSNRIDFSRFDVGALLKLAHVNELSGQSSLAGTVTVTGPLARPRLLRGEANLKSLAVTLSGVRLEGQGGAHAVLAGGRIHLDPLRVTGEDTDLNVKGSLAIDGTRKLDFAAHGSINLKLAETLDPDLNASGSATFAVYAHGTFDKPGLRGTIQFQNGAISLEDIPNGLSQLHGRLEFNQKRLEVRQLTAVTGGGLLSIGGALTYRHGLYADLSVTGNGVRIRYPRGLSSLADARLRLQGSPKNLLLSGNVLITRFAASPDLDLATLAAEAGIAAQTIAPPDAPSNHVRLDIHLVSSPQLNFQNAFAKLAGNVDLRLRGTLASPSVLGQVSITQGSATIAGTRYELQRGNISFTNPVRIDPVIDLTATARVQDYDITLGLHGSPQRPTVTYRSDPPLAESDVVSLLALGHTQDQERLYTEQQEQESANPTTDALLGGALNATMSSRVQKLFGAGSVKVDPDYLGAFGNATSRITVEEQVGRTVTLTYATDVNTTSQQLLQAEIAVNGHVSLVVARDEAGVFSIVLKATRRYR